MIDTLTVLHSIISVLLIVFVLLQFGKGAEAGIFSGGGDGAVFSGAQSGNILTKITTVLTIFFLGLSVTLATLRSNSSKQSIFDNEAPVSAPLNSDAADALGGKQADPNPKTGTVTPKKKEASKADSTKK